MADASVHPAAPHHLPGFITAPGETDVLLVIVGIFLLAVVFGVGTLFLRLHTLPERMAHKGQKLQFEIVAVLGLLALFTHQHIFWVAGLLLALIDIAILWIMAALMVREFHRHSNLAAVMQYPYLAWLTFAAYLNAWVVFAN